MLEILSAYVRATSHRPTVGPATATALQVRPPDVHAAVSVLARRTELAGARASADTSRPDGFDWRAAGARVVDSC